MTKPLTRRETLLMAGAALAAPAIPARAQPAPLRTELPDKPLRILVGYAPGGGTDVMARYLAEIFRQQTGRSILVENRPGASGSISIDALKNSPLDGTTVAYVPSATIMLKTTMVGVTWDPLTDIVPVAQAGTVQTAFIVSPAIGVNNLQDYIEYLKKTPDRRSFGTTALGSNTHFFGVNVGREIGIPLEPVPYKGAAPLVADLQGGHIVAGCGGTTDFLEHHRAGKLKIIFTSGVKPTTSAPEIPTISQAGYPQLASIGWYTFFAPGKTPTPFLDAWNKTLNAVLALPEVKKRLVELGLDVEPATPAEFTKTMVRDLEGWKKTIDAIGYKPQ